MCRARTRRLFSVVQEYERAGIVRRILVALAITALVAGACTATDAGYDRAVGKQLFYRMIGSQSNGPFVHKTRAVAAPDGAKRVAATGMADSGFTEFPFCSGSWSFTFAESMGMFPRIAGGVTMDTSRVNTCDILLDWVYEPDAVVWGPACREFGQTFVAGGRELVGMTLLVASPMAEFTVAVHEGGPEGREVVPRRRFKSGHSMEWGHVRWEAGEAPLAPGTTYYVRIWREDGKAWNPYFHAMGNVCEKGCAWFDGVERPESDLGLWITEETDDVSRAMVVGGDEQGWIHGARGVHIVPRTPNIRLMTVHIQPVKEFCHYFVAHVWTDESRQDLVCGPKYGVACARVGTAYQSSFIYGPGEFDCTPGNPYYVELFAVPFEEGKEPYIPEDRPETPALDLLVRAYGESAATGAPVVYNLRAEPSGDKTLLISWQLTRPATVEMDFTTEGKRRRVWRRQSGLQGAHAVQGLSPGVDVDFTITAVDRSQAVGRDLRRRSPLYRVRMPGGEPAEALWPETPEFFVPLAPRPHPKEHAEPPRWFRRNLVVDGGFEDGVGTWTQTVEAIACVTETTTGIDPAQGKRMYGFTHTADGPRTDVLEQNGIWQAISTRPGATYQVSLRAITAVGDGPRGDTRVRIAVDPQGGQDWSGANSSQWFWTEGEWRRLTHRFIATSRTATLLIGFFRWRDLDIAQAYVDDIRLYEVD